MAKVLQEQNGLIGFDILINGVKIEDAVEVCKIFVQREINKIASATLELVDGGAIGAINTSFGNSEGSDFIPGNEIAIKLGYDSKHKAVFEGIILSQRLKVKNGKSRLIIKCKDKAVKMTNGRLNAVFQDGTESDAFKKIAGKYGLSLQMPSSASDTSVLMQYNCSDWDFLVIRAEVNNMFVVTENNKLAIKKIDFTEPAPFEINAAQFVIDIDLNLDSEKLSDSYQLSSWNDKDQQLNEVSYALADDLALGNISAKKISGVAQEGSSNHFSSATFSSHALKSWGTTLASKAVLGKIQGSIVVPGTTEIKSGAMIQISGFSKRFNGKAFVAQVSHEINEGEWRTTVHVGSASKWHAAQEDIGDIAASGLIPATNGFQIGKVKKIAEDPEGNYRVLVTLPAFTGSGQDEGLWARMSFPYASADAGFFFYPEIHDEVLVSFLNNDPRFPVITGALYSAKNKPKELPDVKNQLKAIHSKSGIAIRFDDEDKILTLETPDGNSFVLDDKEKRTTLKDVMGNTIVMNNSGVIIDSVRDIKIGANGNIEISATGGIDLKANADVKADGANIQLSAKTGFTAKGNASAEISASGQTTVKGAMVMIN